jgi:hypothetical protein
MWSGEVNNTATELIRRRPWHDDRRFTGAKNYKADNEDSRIPLERFGRALLPSREKGVAAEGAEKVVEVEGPK